MADTAAQPAVGKAPWGELFREGRALYTALVIMGTALHALQILVIAIVMPTVVADIGGAAYYTWPAMLYTIGAIIGAASVGPLWNAFGVRNGYALSGFLFLTATVCSALAPDMSWLIAARALQGYAGGLITGGGMALIGGLFDERLRTRILALYQGTWMVAQLFGPAVGGAFAEIGWWRGSFWTLTPIILCFIAIAWMKLPSRLDNPKEKQPFPVVRLTMLASGVFCVALAGPMDGLAVRSALIVAALALVLFTFRLDRTADNRLYPSRAFSVTSPVGLAFWIVLLVGMVHTSVPLFMPLLLQVVHGVSPLWVSFVSVMISLGWTVGTFAVSGWSGPKERLALWTGPLLMLAGLVTITATAELPLLAVVTAAAFVMGVGVGVHNVHLLARTMAAADAGEERITASAMTSIRSLGTAFGAAQAGVLSHLAGLGDATDPAAVGHAVSFVYGVNLLPLAVAAGFMFVLVAMGRRAEASALRATAGRDHE